MHPRCRFRLMSFCYTEWNGTSNNNYNVFDAHVQCINFIDWHGRWVLLFSRIFPAVKWRCSSARLVNDVISLFIQAKSWNYQLSWTRFSIDNRLRKYNMHACCKKWKKSHVRKNLATLIVSVRKRGSMLVDEYLKPFSSKRDLLKSGCCKSSTINLKTVSPIFWKAV